MNQFVLSSATKGGILPSNQSSIAAAPTPVAGERRATLDKFYFSTENFNVVMKLFQDLFRKEYHVILVKNETVKSLVIRSLASAKRKQPTLSTIVEMNKAAVVEGLPAIKRQIELHPDIHLRVPDQDDLFNVSSNESSQIYLEELTEPKVSIEFSKDLENLDSLVSQSAMLHMKPPINQMTPSSLPFPAPSLPTPPTLSTALPQQPVSTLPPSSSASLSSSTSSTATTSVGLLLPSPPPTNSTTSSNVVTPANYDTPTTVESGFDIMQNFQEMQRIKFSNQTKNDENANENIEDMNFDKVLNEVQAPLKDPSIPVQIKFDELKVPLDVAPSNDLLEEEFQEEMLTEKLDTTRRDSLSFPIKSEYTYLEHFVDVSSVDRNFNVKEKFNRYYFSVTFQSQQCFSKPVPIYSNSPVLPTNSTGNDGTLTVTLHPNPTYVPENDLGEVIGWYEMPSSSISKGLNIPDRVSNVTQLSIDSVLLFFSYMDSQCADISDKSFGKTLLHYPYLLLQIKELVSVYKSTNSYYAHNVIKIVRDKTWSQATCGDGFHLFRPVGNEMFTFPTPISSLNRLTIRILNPTGNELCMQQETLLIKKISVVQTTDPSNSANQVWAIEVITSNYFAVCQFFVDHIVCFQDLAFYGSTTLSPFVNWLQSSDGHRIFSTPSTSPNTAPVPISNTFYIKYPITVDWSNGTMSPMVFGLETLETLSLTNSSSLSTCPLMNGSVYNTTIQTHVGFNVLSRNMKSSFSSENVRV